MRLGHLSQGSGAPSFLPIWSLQLKLLKLSLSLSGEIEKAWDLRSSDLSDERGLTLGQRSAGVSVLVF